MRKKIFASCCAQKPGKKIIMGKFQASSSADTSVRDHNDSALSHTLFENAAGEGGACCSSAAGRSFFRGFADWRNPLNWFSCLCTLLIRWYQLCVSPLFPPCCRFSPTCSAYALTAFREHPPWKALLLTVWRLLRCNPWSRGGYDPVPSGKLPGMDS